jgi:hypothetical protein
MALKKIGEILKEQSGARIERQPYPISEYLFGDISSTIYPVNGGLEDWAYAAGWDYFNQQSNQATSLHCRPQTYALTPNTEQSQAAYEHVRSAIYIVETDNSKEPPEDLLGSRLIKGATVLKQSVMERNGQHDGHVNRNIRIALALIDLAQPQIEVIEVKPLN